MVAPVSATRAVRALQVYVKQCYLRRYQPRGDTASEKRTVVGVVELLSDGASACIAVAGSARGRLCVERKTVHLLCKLPQPRRCARIVRLTHVID